MKLGRLQKNNGGEFTSATLRTWLKKKGFSQEFTPPRTPQANGVAERMDRTLQEMARSMMQDIGLGGGSWGEVFLTASYLRNRGLVRDLPSTPQEMWSGVKHLPPPGLWAQGVLSYRQDAEGGQARSSAVCGSARGVC